MTSFIQDIRAVLIPERKWHYLFHLLVMLVASSYWIGSLIKLPSGASWAEIAMYRPAGDNEVYPIISALSQLNFGDPTDALHYGEGTAGSRVIILLPFAVSYALFGEAGYMVCDVVLAWLYFVAITLLLRRCHFGNFSSLLLGAALATNILQSFSAKVGSAFSTLLSLFGPGAWEWGFPNLFDLHIFVARIPRPMETGIFLVLFLYFLLRQWQERSQPSFRRGLAMGSLMTLLLQGDPFSLAALGLTFLWVMGWTLMTNRWRIPWGFLCGSVSGALCFGWYFLWQRALEHPDCSVRFGMADYPRSNLLPLPGYGPLVRVGVVCLLAWLVVLASRSFRKIPSNEPAEQESSKSKKSKESKITEKISTKTEVQSTVPIQHKSTFSEKALATFCVTLVVAAWLAQPVQLFLLGKGCQIYHYLVFVLPTLYAYAAVILFFNVLRLISPSEFHEWLQHLGKQPHRAGVILLALVFVLGAMMGAEDRLSTVSSLTTARRESNVPWAQTGNLYRPSFRALEKEFRENPILQKTRSFAALNYEINFLLTAFYGKRAYLPDNAYSTLSDGELESRFCEVIKILQLPVEQFPGLVQVNFVLNYWLGCAKYWMTSDYQYSNRDDYTDEQWHLFKQQDKQTPWMLCLPKSEMLRLLQKYAMTVAQKSDRKTHPDAIIVGLERGIGMSPNPQWYQPVYTNEIFSVYVKIPEP